MYETTMTMAGRLATAVSQVTFEDGTVKASFRLASTERRFDRGLQQWVDGSRLFLTVVCRRTLAERVLTTLGVGDPVIVTGRLRTRAYEKDGRSHSVLEIEAGSVGPDLARCSAVVARRDDSPHGADDAPSPERSPVPEPGPRSAATFVSTVSEPVTAGEVPEDGGSGAPEPWDGGPLVREYLEHDDHVQTAEPWPDEAAVRA